MDKKILGSKLAMRIVALFFAVILWYFIVITEDPYRSGRIDNVSIVPTGEQLMDAYGLEIIRSTTLSTSLYVEGRRSLVTGIGNEYEAYIDMSGVYEPGYYTLPVSALVPAGVIMKENKPDTTEIYVDKYVATEKPVQIRVTGKPAEGFVVKETTANPVTVQVRAPSLIMDTIHSISVTVDVNGANSLVTAKADVEIYDEANGRIKDDTITFDENAAKKSVEISVMVEKPEPTSTPTPSP